MTNVLPPHNEDLLPSPRGAEFDRLGPPEDVLTKMADRGMVELGTNPPPAAGPRPPVIGALPWDQPVVTYAHLAGFLGGSPDSYTGNLLELIQKADPGNRARLARTYPGEVLAWSIWWEVSNEPGATPPTAAALLGLMLLSHRGGAHPGDPAGTIAAAAWSPNTSGGIL